MKMFKISNDLKLERSWNDSAMCWDIVESMGNEVISVIELSDHEAELMSVKIQLILKDERTHGVSTEQLTMDLLQGGEFK